MATHWSEPSGLLWRTVRWYSLRRFDTVLDPAAVMAHQPQVLKAYLRYERAAQRWSTLDAGLKHLAVMVTATTVGCPWCVDFAWWASDERGVSLEKARSVPVWREATCFSERERLVLEYAEAMTTTPAAVDDTLVARLRRHLSEAQLVELTATVALENLRSRSNRAYGLASQGFVERCPVRPNVERLET